MIRAAIALCLGLASFQALASQSVGGDDWSRYRVLWSGNTAKFGIVGSGTPYEASRTNLSGWQPAGNFGFNTQMPTGPTVGTHYSVPMPDGRMAQGTYTATATKAAMTAGLGTLVRRGAALGAGPLGALLTLGEIANWMANSGVLRNPDHSDVQRPFLINVDGCANGMCKEWSVAQTLSERRWHGSQQQACAAFVSELNGMFAGMRANPRISGTNCLFDYSGDGGSSWSYGVPNPMTSRDVAGSSTRPATWEETVPKWEGGQLPSQVLQQMIDWDRANRHINGIEPFKITFDDGKVTGPASMPPTQDKKTVTTYEPAPTPENPNAQRRVDKTTTTTTEVGLDYEDDKMKVKPKITTTVTTKTTNPDGSVTETTDSTTEETKDKPKEEGPDLCEKYPDIIACQKGQAEDTPLPPVPDLYTQKYPNGIGGIWQTRWNEMKASPLMNLLSGLTPNLGDSGGCPSWQLAVVMGPWDWGTHDVSPPCFVWAFIRVVMVVSALFLARALIFGG